MAKKKKENKSDDAPLILPDAMEDAAKENKDNIRQSPPEETPEEKQPEASKEVPEPVMPEMDPKEVFEVTKHPLYIRMENDVILFEGKFNQVKTQCEQAINYIDEMVEFRKTDEEENPETDAQKNARFLNAFKRVQIKLQRDIIDSLFAKKPK